MLQSKGALLELSESLQEKADDILKLVDGSSKLPSPLPPRSSHQLSPMPSRNTHRADLARTGLWRDDGEFQLHKSAVKQLLASYVVVQQLL